IRNGVPFIKDATIASGAIHAAAIETPQPVTNIYNISFDTLRDDPAQNKVTISTDKFEVKPGIDANTEALIENSLKNAAECAARDVAKQVAADKKAMDEQASYVRTAIMMECLPGGVIWWQCRR
ncbi:Fur-regulated protein, partial [Citrobacter freundii]|nr:Fur-regulated protein [Citrobacter freundii]